MHSIFSQPTVRIRFDRNDECRNLVADLGSYPSVEIAARKFNLNFKSQFENEEKPEEPSCVYLLLIRFSIWKMDEGEMN